MDNHVKQSPMQGMTGLWGGTQGALTSGGAEDPVYIDEVFSTDVWIGNNTTGRNIVNGIDLSGEGGLTWVKKRDSSENNVLLDTVRGANNFLMSDSTNSAATTGGPITAFNSNGFTIDNNGYVNGNNGEYVSWTFRKAKGWFDVKQYSGNNNNVFNLSHDLECKPCFIIIKKINSSDPWIVWIKGLDSGKSLRLNQTNDESSDTDTDLGHTVTSSTIRIPGGGSVNGSSSNSYICYMRGDGAESDGQIFGTDQDQSVMKTGSYSANGSDQSITLGWEPSWILIKKTNTHRSWFLFDNMRGVVTGDKDPALYPNYTSAEDNEGDLNHIDFTSTGFIITNNGGYNNQVNDSGGEYVYVAIRRPDGYVGKPAEAGTDVLAMDSGNGSSTIPTFDSGFPVDFAFYRTFTGSATWFATARLIQKKYIQMCYQDDFETDNDYMFDSNVGWSKNADNSNFKSWMWKRHAGFDVVMYDGDGTGNRAITHQMATAPEMIWFKGTSFNDDWLVYNYYWVGSDQGAIRMNYGAPLNENASANSISPQFGTANPTATTFNVGWSSGKDKTNKNGEKYIAFLFAPVTGISALGSYTGTGQGDSSGPQITGLGFTPRFVLVRSESAGSWCQFDNTLTGLYLVRYNTIGTWLSGDYIEFVSGGFNIIKGPGGQIADVNNNNQKYIYYAHA